MVNTAFNANGLLEHMAKFLELDRDITTEFFLAKPKEEKAAEVGQLLARLRLFAQSVRAARADRFITPDQYLAHRNWVLEIRDMIMELIPNSRSHSDIVVQYDHITRDLRD